MKLVILIFAGESKFPILAKDKEGEGSMVEFPILPLEGKMDFRMSYRVR